MDFFSYNGIIALLQIIFIDLLLAGDNAIVIGMAARNLPDDLRKKAISWGTAGAIGIRLIMAFLFVEAINSIPYLHLVGGIFLLWIGISLLKGDNAEHDIQAKPDLKGAVTTIIIADGIMGIDNVLGVVAAANGHMGMVIGGMLITVPMIIWGSSFFVKMIDKYPAILYLGGGILGWVGADMILADHFVQPYLANYALIFKLGISALVIAIGLYLRKKAEQAVASEMEL